VKEVNELLSVSDAIDIVADLEYSTGRIQHVLSKPQNNWLVEHMQKALRDKLEVDTFPTFRAISLYGKLKKEQLISTTLDPMVAVDILLNGPGIIPSPETGSPCWLKYCLLRYDVPMDSVLAYVPAIMPFLELVRTEGGHTFQNRRDEILTVSGFLDDFEKHDEQEVLVDVSTIEPSAKIILPNNPITSTMLSDIAKISKKEWIEDRELASIGERLINGRREEAPEAAESFILLWHSRVEK